MNFDSNVLQVAIEDIIPNRFQPRLSFEDSSLNELSASIKQHGVIQPLVLRKNGEKYEIIAGERRYKAAMMAGLASVPAVIAQIDDKTSAEVAVVENVQRKDLTAIEEAKSYRALLDLGYMTQEQLARKMGLSQSAIANKLRLLSLANEVQDAIMDNKISERHARSLLIIKEPEKQIEWLNKIVNERLTVRQLDELLRQEYKGDNMNSAIDIEQMKQNATDINPILNSDAPITTTSHSFAMGPIDLGKKSTNKFFNNLEDQAANMQMTEAINPFNQNYVPLSQENMVSEFTVANGKGETTVAEVEPELNTVALAPSMPEIEVLDTLDIEPPKQSVDLTLAKNKIDNLVKELRNSNYLVELVEKKENQQTIYSIIIKDSEN